jgi:hypothetical protein
LLDGVSDAGAGMITARAADRVCQNSYPNPFFRDHDKNNKEIDGPQYAALSTAGSAAVLSRKAGGGSKYRPVTNGGTGNEGSPERP